MSANLSEQDVARFTEAVSIANIPTLLMTLVQMTGERHWLEVPYRPARSVGLGDNDTGGLPDEIQDEIRAAALKAILAWRAGKPLAEAVAEAGAQIEDIGPFGREAGGGNPIPRELLPPIFELRLNEVSMIPAPLSFAVVQLTAITRPGLEGQEAALTTLRNETATALAGDLEAQFGAALRARSDVRFNLRLMNALSAE